MPQTTIVSTTPQQVTIRRHDDDGHKDHIFGWDLLRWHPLYADILADAEEREQSRADAQSAEERDQALAAQSAEFKRLTAKSDNAHCRQAVARGSSINGGSVQGATRAYLQTPAGGWGETDQAWGTLCTAVCYATTCATT